MTTCLDLIVHPSKSQVCTIWNKIWRQPLAFRYCRESRMVCGRALPCMLVNKWNSCWSQNLIYVLSCADIAIHTYHISFPVSHDSTPYHDTAPAKPVSLYYTSISKSLAFSSEYLCPSIMVAYIKSLICQKIRLYSTDDFANVNVDEPRPFGHRDDVL